MTPEQQRITIAEASGWKCERHTIKCSDLVLVRWFKDGKAVGLHPVIEGSGEIGYLPDYLNDLNAIQESKKILNKRQQDVFAGFLGDIIGGKQIDRGAGRINTTTEILFADARQQSEAFLRTIEKWKD